MGRRDAGTKNYVVQRDIIANAGLIEEETDSEKYKIYLSIQFTTRQIQIQNIKMIHCGHQIEFIWIYVRTFDTEMKWEEYIQIRVCATNYRPIEVVSLNDVATSNTESQRYDK